MRALVRAGYLAHAQTAVYHRHLERARETIQRALALTGNPYVGFSGGKDSQALLGLVLEQWPDARAQILTGGETRVLHRNLDQILAWWRDCYPGLRLYEVHIDRVWSDGWQDATWYEQYITFIGEWERYLWTTDRWDGVFLGLREQESGTRRLALRSRRDAEGYAIYRYGDARGTAAAGCYRICPLDQWSVDDVGAYVAEHDMPVLEAYEADGMDARTHTRLGRSSMRMGQLEALRRRDPEAYRRIVRRFPELAR